MRKLSLLFLALLLLLGGCAVPAPDTPTETEPIPTYMQFQVQTDLSAYTQGTQEMAITSYIGVDELEPRDDYGALLPFMGTDLPLYGLMNARGEVVVDPVYSDCTAYAKDGCLVWHLRKVSVALQDEYYVENRQNMLATFDGSKVLALNDGYAYQQEDYIFVQKYTDGDEISCEIYDLQLNSVTTSQELRACLPNDQGILDEFSYSEGMFRLRLLLEKTEIEENSYECVWENYYLRADDQEILGPYAHWAENFSRGVAEVYDREREISYLIDKDGKPLNGRYYELDGEHFPLKYSTIPVCWFDEAEEWGWWGVINPRGEVIAKQWRAGNAYINEHGVEMYLSDYHLSAYYNNKGEQLWADYKPFGEETDEDFLGYMPSQWSIAGEYLLSSINGSCFYDCRNECFVSYPRIEGCSVTLANYYVDNHYTCFSEDFPYYAMVGTCNDVQEAIVLLNGDLEEVLRADCDDWQLERDRVTDEVYLFLFKEGTAQVYDSAMNPVTELETEAEPHWYNTLLGVYDGHILYRTSNEFFCRRTDGTQLFSYPLQTNMD